MKRVLKLLLILLLLILAAAAGLVIWLSATEFRPRSIEQVEVSGGSEFKELKLGEELELLCWNIGYGGLGKESDFFMDGGSMVTPPSQDTVRKNLEGIRETIANTPADIWLFQEVDVKSARSGYQNQFPILLNSVQGLGALAYNYDCPFVPIPLPPIGQVESGIATVTGSLKTIGTPQRISLPCPFSWPVRTANIKRCLLVTRVQLEDSEQELVLVNLHLEAYESGEGRIAQTRQLMEVMQAEYEKGNYVLCAGDFNHDFTCDSIEYFNPGSGESFSWCAPFPDDIIPEGFIKCADYAEGMVPSTRNTDIPYSEDSFVVILDGFIVSDNIEYTYVQNVDEGFQYTDHNPVVLKFILKDN
jgi:endonuclease/exonuclease/phosphatase family metal-dependent hydrolase